jgi:membrane protein DedA with SNARE-associated domain
MNAIFQFVLKHGYAVLFAALFAHQIGLPLPGPLFLLAAGALARKGRLGFAPALLLAVIACVLADWVWYETGRRRGDRVLHFIHSLARDPDVHDRRAKETFARYGPPLLLLCKFVPGLDAVVPPMAGASRTSRLRFLALETAGATLYSSVYTGLGYLLSHDLNRAATYASRAGTFLAALAVVGLCCYAAHKWSSRAQSIKNTEKRQENSISPVPAVAALEPEPNSPCRDGETLVRKDLGPEYRSKAIATARPDPAGSPEAAQADEWLQQGHS